MIVVEFGTSICGQCKYAEGLYSKTTFEGGAEFISLKLDTNPFGADIMSNLGIMKVPSVFVFKKFAADMSAEDLKSNVVARFDKMASPAEINNVLKQ